MDTLLYKCNENGLAKKAIPFARKPRIWDILTILTILAISSCASTPTLIPTPNLYLNRSSYPESELKPEQKNTQIDMFYVTDRLPDPEKEAT